ncbi:nuclear transport factor 2 family protein [Streptomyces sp. Go40/10]|uniref:nuclear transport factor 2 family protein n=1 Tax=Streptomyces sp. Go40/10 TaxID=2825844 RepID=UPI001E29DDF0|nr:nuclear transport factor 2 family protein [Streptomyces sp. Go40/10]UFQ99739.1 nuclear transport factor 2 family protein [Streptomyces sp. Go40/10]UFR07207.1 nuclear transport factor 2 family protein [Streptomyces sp. Go40/10]
MPEPLTPHAKSDVVHAYRAYLQAMADGDTQALDDLLNDGFTLTHITGYVQPKAEWLSQMRSGQFTYHTIDEHSLTVDNASGNAHLVGKIITDATVYGTRARWRLQLTLDYAHTNNGWTALHSVATTW